MAGSQTRASAPTVTRRTLPGQATIVEALSTAISQDPWLRLPDSRRFHEGDHHNLSRASAVSVRNG